MERIHKCKYCSREFASGKALGGHTRAHMMKLKNKERVEEDEDVGASAEQFDEYMYGSCFSTSEEEESSEEVEEEDEEYRIDLNSSKVLQNGESGTEASGKVDTSNCRRSKRVRKLRDCYYSSNLNNSVEKARGGAKGVTDDYLWSSSGSEATTMEEHGAHCLIMLSRDKWVRDGDNDKKRKQIVRNYVENFDSNSKSETKTYKCEECDKMFNSHQALGGHKASHNKIKANTTSEEPASAQMVKIYKCPFCHKIFTSGQALGGHKRSHFTGRASSSSDAVDTTDTDGSSAEKIFDIDLNLPAPLDGDIDYRNVASITTDAERVLTIKK